MARMTDVVARTPRTRRDQRGIALLTMLLIAALASMLVVTLIDKQGRLQRELSAGMQQDQIIEYDRGAAMFAMAALQADAMFSSGTGSANVDSPTDFWAQPFPPYPVPGGIVSFTLRDAQARFNLNSLVSAGKVNDGALAFYRRLLTNLMLPTDLADSLVDWEDADSSPYSAAGAEDDYYLSQMPPYRAANRHLSTYSELRLVKGYSGDVLRLLAPWVTVLPSSANTINVNFITPNLLQAMVPGLSSDAAMALLQQRPVKGWQSVSDFMNNPVFNGVDPTVRGQIQSLLSVNSSYFELYTRIRFGERTRLQWTLIARHGTNVSIIANERNPLWMPDNAAASAAAMAQVQAIQAAQEK